MGPQGVPGKPGTEGLRGLPGSVVSKDFDLFLYLLKTVNMTTRHMSQVISNVYETLVTLCVGCPTW